MFNFVAEIYSSCVHKKIYMVQSSREHKLQV